MVFGHILNCSIQSKNIFIFILICFWIQKTKNYQRKHFHKKIPKFVTLWTRPNTPFFTKNYKFVQKIKNCPNNEEKNRPKDPIWKGKVSKLFVKIEHAFISCCTNKINFWRKAFFQSETYQIRFTFWINTKNFDWFWNFQEKNEVFPTSKLLSKSEFRKNKISWTQTHIHTKHANPYALIFFS